MRWAIASSSSPTTTDGTPCPRWWRSARAAAWSSGARLGGDPRHSVSGLKRLLGRPRAEPQVAEMLQAASFPTLAGPNGEIQVELDGKPRSLVELGALVLAAAREQAERHLRRSV